MAMRGAAAACNAARQTNNHPIAHSIPRYLRAGFHHSLSRPVRRFSPCLSFPYELKYPIRAVHKAAADPITSKKEDEGKSSQDWKIKMLYDGDCPLCMREVNMLRERNKSHGTIKFVDISSDEYSPEENQGLDYKTVMGRIHAILSDGTVVTDVEFCRHSEDYMNKLVLDGFMLLLNMNLLQQWQMRYIASGLSTVFKLQAGHLWRKF